MLLGGRQRLQITFKGLQPSIEAIVAAIKAQVDEIEGQMVGHARGHFAELDHLLQSASGIGAMASAGLIAELPELGRLNRREIAAQVGVAPMANDSGASKNRLHASRANASTSAAQLPVAQQLPQRGEARVDTR